MLVDRIKDMIIRGGENIYPKEIETVVYQHAGDAEAAVIGAPHPVYGEVPVLFVSLYPGADRHRRTAHSSTSARRCRNSSSRSRSPLSTSLPKNPVGKIDKPTLRRSLITLQDSHRP